jgi:hypothetical protein
MMPDHFINDEPQKLLGKVGIKLRILGQFAQAGDLAVFAARISGGKTRLRLVPTHSLRHLKPLGEHEDQSRIDIVDAVAVMLQLRVRHPSLPRLHLP